MSTKILVVEDERIIAEDLKETLQGLFYEVPDIACSGEEAISKAEQLSVDLVLMDIRLSGDMDGIEAAQHIYEHFDIPVIYMTANSDIATLERAKKTRPFGYLLKPFKERELHTTIEISLYRHQMEMQVKSLQIDLQNKVDLLEQQNSEIRQLSRALEQSPVSVAITDTQGKTEYVNQNFIDTTGYSRQESIGQESDLIKSGTDLSPFHQQLKETITAGRTWHGDFCNQRRNGETLWESASISPVRSTSEEITHFVVIKENITEKKERHELQSACQLLREKFGQMTNGDDIIPILAELSDRLEALALPFETIDIKLDHAQLFSRAQYHRANRQWQLAPKRVIATGNSHIEAAFSHGKIQLFSSQTSAFTQRDTDALSSFSEQLSHGFLHIEDLKALEESEAKFRQAQKMEAIGQLAGGMAHDFNNIISVINGYAQLINMSLGKEDERHNDIAEILTASGRAAELIRQLLTFSRNQETQPKVININDIVAGMEKMLRRLIGENIELDIALAPEVCDTLADPSQLEQVLMNLVVNARDAMPTGGHLYIETAQRTNTGTDAGTYALLAVSDSGIGIDATTQERIFEPFFTTKKKDEGTGLGLATTYGIVTGSGGSIEVESEKGHGARFEVLLPASMVTSSDALRSEQEVFDYLPTGNETILFVEDDEILLELGQKLLSTYGYEVLCCSRAEEALALATNNNTNFDLLITDIIMPGMDGYQLARRMIVLHPDMKLLLCSGYNHNMLKKNDIDIAQFNFMKKPFQVDEFVIKVRSVLDGKMDTEDSLVQHALT